MAAKAQVLSVRDQAKVVNEILNERLNNLLPSLMQKAGIDMWVIISREYNEDPVLKTMLPAEWLNARRRTILVFCYNPQKKILEKLAVARIWLIARSRRSMRLSPTRQPTPTSG